MTDPKTMKLLALMLAAVLAAAACGQTSDDPAEATDELAAEEENEGGNGKDGKAGGRGGKGGRGGGGNNGGGRGQGDGMASGSAGGGGGGGGAIDPALRTASARVEEPRPNSQKGGAPPPYTELIAAEIKGLGDDFRITLTFADNIPSRMPDDETFMVVAIGFKGRRDNQRYGFGAQATDKGWEAYAGGENRAAKRFPGTFRINGPNVEMTIPSKFIRGPYRFAWQGSSSWFRSVAGTNHYAFDPIPTEGEAPFPGS